MGNHLPKGWVETDLDTVIERMSNGSSLKQHEQFFEGALPISRIETIADGTIDFNRVKYVEANESEIEKYELLDGDILFSHINSDKHLGKTAFFHNEDTLLHGINLLLLRSSKVVNSEFIYLVLRDLRYSGKFIEVAQRSVNQSSINQKKLKAFRIPLPPRAEQDRIVTKVDALMAQHTAIQQAMERIPQLLKDFKQQVLTQAVTGKLTEEWRVGKELEDSESFISDILKRRKVENPKFKIPDNVNPEDFPFDQPETWSFAFLQTFGEFTRGKSKHRPRNDERLFGDQYPFIQTGAVSKVDLITEADKYLSEFGLKQSRLFPKGTLCITIAANIAETAILDIDCCFPDSVVGYLPFEDLYSAKFAMFYLRTIQKELEQYAPATAQKNINLGILFKVPFPVPPFQEQQEIVRRVESLFEKATAIEQRYEKLKTQIDTLPQSILHKAFKGELVEQLDSDGSALELLKEIESLKK